MNSNIGIKWSKLEIPIHRWLRYVMILCIQHLRIILSKSALRPKLIYLNSHMIGTVYDFMYSSLSSSGNCCISVLFFFKDIENLIPNQQAELKNSKNKFSALILEFKTNLK